VKMTFDDFQASVAAQIPVRRIGQVADVAHTISFLASEDAGYVSGQVIYVAGGPLC
jgi:3-oxoacyl-[acyl-carrier protein] reductase